MSRIQKHVAGALLLAAATAACSGRASGGPMDAAFVDAAARPRPMPMASPLAGHVSGGLVAGGETPEASPSVQAVPPLVPIETGPYVQEVAPGTPANLTSYSAIFSPDGAWYAYGYPREGTGEAVLHVGPVAGPAMSTDYVTSGQIFWSPDSRRLAFAQLLSSQWPVQKYALRSWDVEARRAGTLVDSVEVMTPWVAWVDKGIVFLDGSDLLFKGQDGAPVRLAAIADTNVGGGFGARAVYPSPDGKRLAFLAPAIGFTAAASLVVHDLETGEARAIRRVPKDLSRLVWAETGDALGYLAGGYGQYELHRVRLADGAEEVTPFYLGEPVVEKGPNWTSVTSPYASDLSPNLKWCLVNRRGPLYAREMATGKHVQLTSGPVNPSSWTADSRHVFVSVQGGAPERTRYYKVQVER